MKTLKLIILVLVSTALFNCSSDSDKSPEDNPPTDADGIASILVIPNSSIINSKDLPTSSDAVKAPVVSHIDTNVSYSSGSQMYLPCDVASPGNKNIAGVYIQVKGASTYFDVTINSSSPNALISIPINLPSVLGSGTFTLLLKFYDEDGNISLEITVNITITAPDNCGTTKVSGGEGLTSNIFKLPNQAGQIKITYDTYTVPDKIDIYQNGSWCGGTGFATTRNTLRKALNCDVATEAFGYVGEQGEFVFNYNPALGQEIEVVVSGCEDGGTLWEYTFSCPQEPSVGQSNFTIDGNSYTNNLTTACATISSNNNYILSSVHGESGDSDYISVVLTFYEKPTTSGTIPVGHDWDVFPDPGQVLVNVFKGGKNYGARDEGAIQVTVVNGKVKAEFTNIPLKGVTNIPMIVSGSIICP